MDDGFNEVVLREKEKSLHISRVPRKVKESFVKLASEEFAEDYGMTLKWCLEQAIEYNMAKPLFYNLSKEVGEKSTVAKQEEKPGRKMLSGEVKGGQVKDE